MKNVIFIVIFLASYLSLSSQNLSNCHIVEWTLDDITQQHYTDYGYNLATNIAPNCGSNFGNLGASNCQLVRIRTVKTVGGQLMKFNCSALTLSPANIVGVNAPLVLYRDYFDIYDLVSNTEYMPQGGGQGIMHNSYILNLNVDPGEVAEFLVCKGSENGDMRVRFSTVTFCTNTGVQYFPPNTNGNNTGTTPPNPPTVNPSRPTTILQAQIGSYPVDITYQPKGFCYQNGSVGQAMSDCSSCNNGSCIVLQLVKTNIRGDMNEKLPINTKDLNNFLKSKNGRYNGNAFVFKDGSISDKLGITNGPGKTKGRKISIKMGN